MQEQKQAMLAEIALSFEEFNIKVIKLL